MDEYEIECTKRFEGTYTLAEVELNKRLYEECSKEVLDCNAIEKLLLQGADPLGATAVSGWGVLDHIYYDIICESQDTNSINLPQITALFLKHGMNIAKPRVPYDTDNSINPMWSFSCVPNENAIVALKMLLDHELDAESVSAFWDHSIFYQINIYCDDPNDPDSKEWFVWTFKMIMLIASYDHVLNNDEDLRNLIGCAYNNYDTRKFREWDNYYYEFDTSRCMRSPELYKAVVHIYEAKSKQEVWKIGMFLKENEF